MAFNKRSILRQTTGQIFKKIREAKNQSLKDIAQQINIPIKYLMALEEDNYSLLPPPPYLYGILKKYANFLGLNAEEIVSQFKKENVFSQRILNHLKGHWLKRFCPKKIIFFDQSKILIFVVILSIIFYLGFSIWQTISLPEIKIFYPPNNFITTNSLIEIKGQVKNSETLVFINGLMVDKIENGRFSQVINLSPGLNIVKISAQKEIGKEKKEKVVWRKIILKKE